MSWIDITTPLCHGMPVYPGDPPVRIGRAGAEGDEVQVTTLATGLHAGTHIDAPAHVIRGGAGADAADPAHLMGECAVVAAGPGPLGADEVAALLDQDVPGRVLLRTGHGLPWPPHDGPGLTPAGAREAVAHGVRLLGIDTMSVAGGGGAIEAHRILLEGGVVPLEGLDLRRVAPGRYRLVCLPLLVPGADGAPARALLWPAGAAAAGP